MKNYDSLRQQIPTYDDQEIEEGIVEPDSEGSTDDYLTDSSDSDSD